MSATKLSYEARSLGPDRRSGAAVCVCAANSLTALGECGVEGVEDAARQHVHANTIILFISAGLPILGILSQFCVQTYKPHTPRSIWLVWHRTSGSSRNDVRSGLTLTLDNLGTLPAGHSQLSPTAVVTRFANADNPSACSISPRCFGSLKLYRHFRVPFCCSLPHICL